MKRFIFSIFHCFLIIFVSAQVTEPSSPKAYRATDKKINNLIHTKLKAKFDYSKSYMNGKVWLTLKPHFYPTDSLTLDAKGMQIKNVSLLKNNTNSSLKYDYDDVQ